MKKNYSNVQIFGPPNSGTNLMARLIIYGIENKLNIKPAGGTHINKHTFKPHVLKENVMKHKNTLFICTYRSFDYWIESIRNNTVLDLEWDSKMESPLTYAGKKFDNIYDFYNGYYNAYRELLMLAKFKNVIFVDYSILINKKNTYNYLLGKFIKTTLRIKSEQKIIEILEKPSRLSNKKMSKTCDQAYDNYLQLKDNNIEEKYWKKDTDIISFFEGN